MAGGVPTPAFGSAATSGELLVLGSLVRTYALQPGDLAEGEIMVRNVSSEPQIVRLYPRDYLRTGRGVLAFPDAGTLPRSNSAWMEGVPQEQVLAAGATVTLRFTIRVPEDPVPPGTYWSVIMVQGFPLNGPDAVQQTGRVTVVEAFRTAVRVVTEVTVPGIPVEASLRFMERALVMGEAGPELHLTIENDGPSQLQLSVWAEVTDPSGLRVGRFRAPSLMLLPGETGLREISLAELAPGRYEVLVVADGQGEDVFGARYQMEIPDRMTTAWGREIRVRRIEEAAMVAEPGDVVTLAFDVENRSRVPQTLIESLDLPQGWRTVIPPGSFRLGPAERTVRLVSVQPGVRAAGGGHDLGYRVLSQDQPDVEAGLRTRIDVAEWHAIHLVAMDPQPPSILAGESVLLGIQLLNEGNTPLGLRLSARGGVGATVEVIPDTVHLGIGEHATAHVRVAAEQPSLGRVVPVTVTANPLQAMEGELLGGSLRLDLNLLPAEISGGAWVSYPVTVSTQQVWDGGASVSRATIQANGPISAGGDRRMQFHLTTEQHGPTPGLPTNVRQAWGGISFPWGQVVLGDRSFRLSELMGPGSQGRGLGVALTPAGLPVRLSGFSLARRDGEAQRTDLGGTATLGPWAGSSSMPSVQFQLHTLQRAFQNSGVEAQRPERTLALDGHLSSGPGLRLEGAYARRPGAGGWQLQASGRWSAAGSYRLRIWEDRGLSSTGIGIITYDGQLNVPMGLGFRGLMTTRYVARSSRMADGGRVVRRDLRHRGRLARPLWTGAVGSFEIERSERRDFSSSSARSLQQRDLRLAITQTLGALHSRGELQDRSGGAPGYRLAFTYRPSRAIHLRIQSRKPPHSPTREDTGSVHWQPTSSVRLHGAITRTGNPFLIAPTAGPGRFSQIGLGAAMVIDADQDLRLDLQRMATPLGGDRFGVQLLYQRRLAIPVARRPGFGTLEGVALLERADGLVPLAHALVRVAGVAQRTDSEGRFRFQALPEGTHVIRVETPVSLGGGAILPLERPEVLIRAGGRSMPVELTLHEGGTLRGILVLPEVEPGPGLESPWLDSTGADPSGPSLAGIGISLRQGELVRRTWTDGEGRFLLQALTPGTWTLHVDQAGLPPFTRLEQDASEVTITSGTASELMLQVVPVQRRFRLVDEGPVSGVPL